jgi:two-component system, OmpR family, phosphate regulon sensor histidine kinase PhoR
MTGMEPVFLGPAASPDRFDLVDLGGYGLPAVQRLVQRCRDSLDSVAVAFVELGPTGGRVVAATGASGWSAGRHIDPRGPLVAMVVSAEDGVEGRSADQPPDIAGALASIGIRRVVGIRVAVGTDVVGLLFAGFAEDLPVRPGQHGILRHFAGMAAQLYDGGHGLPVYAGAPAVSAMADAIAVVDGRGIVRSWNIAAVALTGRAVGAAVGRPLPVPLPRPGHALEHRLPDGRRLQILATALPDGEGRVVTLRDVSEAHRREEARELFVAVTSHELRTPVTVIKGYADTLVDHWDELPEPARRDAAQRLRQRAGDLARLVERLLSAVGDGAGLTSAMPLPFDLVEAIRTAVADLPLEVRRRVRTALVEAAPKALGERASLATVLVELITNAVKHSPPDAPILVEPLVDAGSVGFRVVDRGDGIRPEHVERAFERFWQAQPGNEHPYGGVGLGLYLVRQIIERQKGWVSLRPREHGGTVAEVRLPRADLGPGGA